MQHPPNARAVRFARMLGLLLVGLVMMGTGLTPTTQSTIPICGGGAVKQTPAAVCAVR